jgi:hypothetical protein
MPERANPFGIADARLPAFCGRRLSRDDWDVIREIIDTCGLSRWQLAMTICECLGWVRANGNPKTRECFEWLGVVAELGVLAIPVVQARKPQVRKRIEHTDVGRERPVREGTLRDVRPVEIELVRTASQRAVWRELVDRHHYLGDAVPYGAQLRYLMSVSTPGREVAGCLQFSSPAWKLETRDRWLGWNDRARLENLQRIVNNSRFLILPWFRIKGLASHILARAAARLVDDWEEVYAVRPVLLETFVETGRFDGTCYKAANWIALGETAGRGRQDRANLWAEPVKTYFVRPLVGDFRRRLGAPDA